MGKQAELQYINAAWSFIDYNAQKLELVHWLTSVTYFSQKMDHIRLYENGTIEASFTYYSPSRGRHVSDVISNASTDKNAIVDQLTL